MRLASVAPRLALALYGRRIELANEKRQRQLARERVLHTEWLVAHRELQLCRAQVTRSGAYIEQRQRKLDQARREHRRAEEQAARLGV